MADPEQPFDLTGEYVQAESAMLDEMAAALPMMGDYAQVRKMDLTMDPDAYFDERVAEATHDNEMASRILRRAGIKEEEE